MNIYKKVSFAIAGIAAIATLSACSSSESVLADRLYSQVDLTSILMPTPSKPLAVSAEKSPTGQAFDEWNAWKDAGPLPKTVFLDKLGVPDLQDIPEIRKQNGYIATGLLGSSESCVIAISDVSSTSDDRLSVAIAQRFNSSNVVHFEGVSESFARYAIEMTRVIMCP